MEAFLLQDVSNSGNRGRPPLAREVYYKQDVVLSDSGVELGEIVMEPQSNGTVVLTAVVDGNEQKIVFGKAKGRRPSKAKKATKRTRNAE
jgi:hypothetical protein